MLKLTEDDKKIIIAALRDAAKTNPAIEATLMKVLESQPNIRKHIDLKALAGSSVGCIGALHSFNLYTYKNTPHRIRTIQLLAWANRNGVLVSKHVGPKTAAAILKLSHAVGVQCYPKILKKHFALPIDPLESADKRNILIQFRLILEDPYFEVNN